MRVQEVVDAFLASKESDGVSGDVLGKYKRELKRFVTFCERQGRYTLAQVTRPDLDLFRKDWKSDYPANVTRAKVLERLKTFFKYASDSGMVAGNVSAKIKGIKLTDADRQKPQPFTEAELKKMFETIPGLSTANMANRIRVMIKFMAATGTAIADTVKLERSNIVGRGGETWLEFYRQKTKRHVQQRLDPALVEELLSVANGNPRYFFWSTGDGKLKSATGYWRDKVLLPLMKAAGCYTKGNVSHRFRDTAVDYWVSQGVVLADIAVMLGDSEKIVEKHYKTRLGRQQERLARVPIRKWDTQAVAARQSG